MRCVLLCVLTVPIIKPWLIVLKCFKILLQFFSSYDIFENILDEVTFRIKHKTFAKHF